MKLSQIVSGLLTATIVLAMSACGSQTDSTPSDQVAGKEASRVTQVPAPSEHVTSKDTDRVVAVQPGSQPAWSNEGDQSEGLLVTLRSSQALMKAGESAMLKASANNLTGKPLSVNMVLQLGNGLILSSATSCTGDPCTGQFDIPHGKQALMSVLVQSSGPVAQSYSVILHYNYPDPKTGNEVQGKVEGLIGATEHVVARVPRTTVELPQGNKLVVGPTSAPTSHSNLATAPTYTPEPTPGIGPTSLVENGVIKEVERLVFITPTPSPAAAPYNLRATKIIFTSLREDNPRIYVMNSDGSRQTDLTHNSSIDYGPDWSPDGRRVAFYSGRDGNFEIYVMNADGSGQTRLTNNPAYDSRPAWSPDDRFIAFTSNRVGNNEIYVMNTDGASQTGLTDNLARGGEPAWSPDGRRIAFSSKREGNFEIYVMNADGSGQTNLTHSAGDDFDPDWSPDGRRIAFYSERDGNREIYGMNADGTGQTNLTNNPADDFHPDWSPDGRHIAFSSERDGDREIYVMNADGTGLTNLTNNPADDFSPVWSPFIQ